ncbi:MAG: LysM peptidoglycan-binding domain-containing protein [Lentisphaeria bacterium]|nr:LysM peptidoglycan-binding domain-containing protein [Lentisphaeria bacterium]
MKKTQVVLTLAGLLVLTGCTEPVMRDNRYIPAQDDRAIGESRQYDDFGSDNKTFGSIPPASADSQADQFATVQPQQPQPQTQQPQNNRPYRQYAPMENVKSSGGITDSGSARKSGKKGRRSTAKSVSAKGGTYVVKSGDYPAKIAKKFGVSVSALLEANKMTMADAKKLQIGQKLVIPARGKKAGKKSAGKTETKVESGVYIVRSGDVPARIARRLKVKLADLLKVNDMTLEDAKKLQIGQKLIIPGKGVKKQADVKTDAGEKKTDKQDVTQKKEEKKDADVNSADDIAKKIEADSVDNKDKDTFEGGTDPYELTEDTTIRELAAKLNVSEATLRRLNPELTGDNLSKGDCVMIPARK